MPGYGPNNTPLKRIQIKNIRDAILNVLNLEKGIGYTLLNLAVRPGEAINTYLFEDRRKMVKPVGFLIFVITVATFLTVNFVDIASSFSQGIEMGSGGEEGPMEGFDVFMEQIFGQFYNVLSFLAVPLLAFGSYVVYNNRKYNFAEHLVINAYLTAFITVLYILSFPVFVKWYQEASIGYLVVSFIYWTYAYIRIFKEPTGKGILKGIGIQLIYYILFGILTMAIGVVLGIYWVSKMKG